MPLRLWLPLDGSARNIGIYGITMSGSPASWGNGRLGKCATFNNSTSNRIFFNGTDFRFTTEDFSWAFWLKKDFSSKTAGSMWAFTLGRQNSTGGYGYGLQVTSTNNVQAKFGSSTWTVSGVPDNTWHHVAFTRSGTSIGVYIDGELKSSTAFSGTLPTYADALGISVGTYYYSNSGTATHVYPLIGSIQDFRLYDHALSKKEVVELSKGMVIHYTLDNPYNTGMLNFYSGTNARGNPATTSFTVTKLANEDGYNYKLTRTGTTSNYYANIRFPAVSRASITAGKKYTWSAKIRVHTWTAGTFSLRSAIASNDYTNGSVRAADTSLVDNRWRQISRTITLTEGMKIGSKFYYITDTAYNESTESSKGYMAPLVEFYTNNQNSEGTTYDMDFDLKEVQLIESDFFPGWIDNSMSTRTLRDTTGRGNDGTVSGAVTTATGSPRFPWAYQFSGGSCIWPIPDPISSNTEEFTISMWFMTTTVSTTQCLWNGRSTTGKAVAIFLVNTNAIRIDDSTQTTISPGLTVNTWYHLAVTWKSGGNKVIYLDGEQKTSVAAGTLSKSNTRASIGRSSSGDSLSSGNYFSGQMSDFRIYMTALTAAQVKELYNAPISVANTGACLAVQFTDGVSGISFAKNGVASGSNLFTRGTLVEPDGTKWIRVGHHLNPTTYKFSSSDPFATGVWTDMYRFLDGGIMDMADKWEFIIEQKKSASATVERFRWSQTKSPNAAAFADVAAASVTKKTSADGYTNISSSYGGIYKTNGNTYYCANNGTAGNWYGAIGCWTAHNGGIPAYNGGIIVDGGYIDLYLRVDNVTWNKSKADFSLDKDGLAVLSPEFVEQ